MAQAALPWMRVPISIQPGAGQSIADVPGMEEPLRQALLHGAGSGVKQNKAPTTYRDLFPIQAVVWTELGGGLRTGHDLCIAAPTGSGKTLAYALPVLNALAKQSLAPGVHCLRALVVLPTRDLAQQVAAVMQPLCTALGLNLQLAAAQVSPNAEADAIMGTGASHAGLDLPVSMSLLTAGAPAPPPSPIADVLVATPGRLMTHLNNTPGFSLSHLRFLVVDETDRLLRQSYQDWLPSVIQRVHGPDHIHSQWHRALTANGGTSSTCSDAHNSTIATSSSLERSLPRCVKLIVSATLTRDPAKLQRLALHNPRYIAVSTSGQRYQLPKSLQEYKVLCSTARKPITLLALLKECAGQSCVVFASSLDTTHRLYLLLKAVMDKDNRGTVVECSGHKAAAAQRAAAVQSFKSGAATILVASDVVTRGMDFDGVFNVINYDAPVYAKTYVHRAGRTARAGRPGRVFTLLRDEDVRHFKAMLRKADNSYVKDYKLPAGAADAMAQGLSAALQQVSELLAAEAEDDRGRLAREPKQQAAQKRVREQEQA